MANTHRNQFFDGEETGLNAVIKMFSKTLLYSNIGLCILFQIATYFAFGENYRDVGFFASLFLGSEANLENYQYLIVSGHLHLAYAYSLTSLVWKFTLFLTIPFCGAVVAVCPGGLKAYLWRPLFAFLISFGLAIWFVFFHDQLFSFSGMKKIFGPNPWTMPIVSTVIPAGSLVVGGQFLRLRGWRSEPRRGNSVKARSARTSVKDAE
jgi:hypothetical protein